MLSCLCFFPPFAASLVRLSYPLISERLGELGTTHQHIELLYSVNPSLSKGPPQHKKHKLGELYHHDRYFGQFTSSSWPSDHDGPTRPTHHKH